MSILKGFGKGKAVAGLTMQRWAIFLRCCLYAEGLLVHRKKHKTKSVFGMASLQQLKGGFFYLGTCKKQVVKLCTE